MNGNFQTSLKIAAAVCSSILVTACGGSSGDGGLGGGDGDCSPQNAGCYFESNTSIAINQFDSRWLSNCEFLEDYDGKYSADASYRVESLLIAGDIGSRTTNYYTDSSCSTPASVSEVSSSLAFFYASVFTDNTVGVDNIVLVNITASNFTFDSAEPSADQQAEMSRSRADRTYYTAIQRIDSALYIGKPQGFTDGSNSDDRILNPYDPSGFSSDAPGIMYTQQ